MIRRTTIGMAVWLLLLASSSIASAEDLSKLLVNLIQADILLPNTSHSAHFAPGADQQIAPFFFNQQIVSQLATFPLGSSSGGFAYRFDPTTGTFQRATDSFGPSFAERA